MQIMRIIPCRMCSGKFRDCYPSRSFLNGPCCAPDPLPTAKSPRASAGRERITRIELNVPDRLCARLFAGAATRRSSAAAGATGSSSGAGCATACGRAAGRSAAARRSAGIGTAVAAAKDKHERRGRQHHTSAVGRNFHL